VERVDRIGKWSHLEECGSTDIDMNPKVRNCNDHIREVIEAYPSPRTCDTLVSHMKRLARSPWQPGGDE
jgi:hypothetical protein